MLNKNQNNNSNAGEFQASPFLVDLRKMAEEKENLARMEAEKKRFGIYRQGISLFSRCSGLVRRKPREISAGVINKKAAQFTGGKAKGFFALRDGKKRNSFLLKDCYGVKAIFKKKLKSARPKKFSYIYRLCCSIGWYAIFFFKFSYLIILSLFKPVAEIRKKAKLFFFRHSDNLEASVVLLYPVAKIFIYRFFHIYIKESDNDPSSEKINGAVKMVRKKVKKKMAEKNRYFGILAKWEKLEAGAARLQAGIINGLKIKRLKPVVSFALALILLIAPFKAFTYYAEMSNLKGKVLGVSEAAMGELGKAGESAADLNFGQASKNFTLAGSNFLQAQNELNGVNDLLIALAGLMPNKEMRLAADADNILAAGRTGSELGSALASSADCLFSGGKENIGQSLGCFISYGKIAKEKTKELGFELNGINVENLPDGYADKFSAMKDKISFIAGSLDEALDIAEKLRIFLGAAENKRYLLVFQNNAEMRASGGFIGSYAVADFQNGKIKKIEIPGGGSYDTEAGLYKRIKAPAPLRLVNAQWHFWDANWWPDWPTTAKKLMWFYENSGGTTVDGVIGITPTVMEKILEITGPLDMTEKYGKIITADNFWEITQEFSEEKADDNEPKKIIGDMAEKILAELPKKISKETLIDLMSALESGLNEKHILFYFADKELQDKAAGYGWDGRLKSTKWDYLSVVNTNIAGGKSDKKIAQTISHTAEVAADGTIFDTVEIKREHTGIKNELFTGVRNVDWLRVYVPRGSELVSAEGFAAPDENFFEQADSSWIDDPALQSEENAAIDQTSGTKIYDELGKTVFANWSMIDPGREALIVIKYKLPFKITDNSAATLADKAVQFLNPTRAKVFPYALFTQKQPGSYNYKLNSRLIFADNFQVIWRYPGSAAQLNNGWQISDKLNVDKYWAVLITMTASK